MRYNGSGTYYEVYGTKSFFQPFRYCFDTLELAEKAVEKLKTSSNLKGYKFTITKRED